MSRILITGATGFVGSHVTAAVRGLPDVRIRVLVRDAHALQDSDGLDVVEGDLDDDETRACALRDVDCAYYLVHSMEPGNDGFAERDKHLAEHFARSAEADVGRVTSTVRSSCRPAITGVSAAGLRRDADDVRRRGHCRAGGNGCRCRVQLTAPRASA